MPEQGNAEYLQSEGKFTKSASLNTRYQFVQQNAGSLGKDIVDRYSDGSITTADNTKLMDAIKRSPALQASYEAIIGNTREKMSQLQRDIEPKKERGFFGRLFNRGETQTSSQPGLDYSRKIGAKEMVTKKDITADQATKKVIEDKKYYDYASLKKEISVAIARDVSGSLVEGGLFGILYQNNNIKTMLDNKSPTEQARIRDELNRLSNTYVAGDEPGFVRKIFGGRSTNDIRNVLNGSFVSSRRKKAILETLTVAALSLVASGGTSISVLLGKIKTPLTIQKVVNPGSDVAAYTIYGKNAQEVERERSEKHEELDYQLIDAGAKEIKNIRGSASKFEVEYNNTLTNGKLDWKNPKHREAYLRLQRARVLDNEQNGPIYRKFVSMVTGVTNVEAFKETFSLPRDPDVEKGLRAFYEGGRDAYAKYHKPGDFQILIDMLSDPDKYIGASGMVRSQKIDEKTSDYIKKHVNSGEKTPGKKKNSDSFSTPLESLNMQNVFDRFNSDPYLMGSYIDKIHELTGATVTRDAILNAIQQGQVTEITGLNTGLLTTKASAAQKKLLTGGAYVIAVPVETSSGGRGVQLLGIKGDCTNYIPGGFIPQETLIDDKIDIKGRLHLMWNIALNKGSGGNVRNENPQPKTKTSQTSNIPKKAPTITKSSQSSTPGSGSGPTENIPQTVGKPLDTSIVGSNGNLSPGHTSIPDITNVGAGNGNNPLGLSGN